MEKLPILVSKTTQALKLAKANPRERMNWSHSSIKCFRNCKRMFYWKYILGLSPKVVAVPMTIGYQFSLGLEAWYSDDRADMEDIAAKICNKAEREAHTAEGLYDADDYDKLIFGLTALAGMLIGYAKRYKSDRKKWPQAERLPEISFNIDLGDFWFNGRMDLVARSGPRSNTIVVETKTLSKMKHNYIEVLPLDGQVHSYVFGTEVGLERKVARVLYNVVKKCSLRRKKGESKKDFIVRISEDYKARPEFYFWREELRLPKEIIPIFLNNLRATNAEYKTLLIEQDPLDPYSWTQNDFMCDLWSGCSFFPLCRQGLDCGTEKMYNVRAKRTK